ncbi:MAG TPA: hypothetical protein VGM70_01495 [Pseudolysinimonas sp.]|jgi:hypothetical protein
MNSSTGMLEAPPSRDRTLHHGAEASSSPARPAATRSALADRLALRLGMALVIWSRQHAARQDARLHVRVVLVARRAETEDRRARQYAADRQALVGMPRP